MLENKRRVTVERADSGLNFIIFELSRADQLAERVKVTENAVH